MVEVTAINVEQIIKLFHVCTHALIQLHAQRQKRGIV